MLTVGTKVPFYKDKWRVIQKNEADTLLTRVNLFDEVLEIGSLPVSAFGSVCEYKKHLEEKKQKKEPLILKVMAIKEFLVLPYKEPYTVIF